MQVHDLKVRVPSDVKAWLAARAKVNNRSVNGEIVQLIKAERERSAPQQAAQ